MPFICNNNVYCSTTFVSYFTQGLIGKRIYTHICIGLWLLLISSKCFFVPHNVFKWNENVWIIVNWYIPPMPLHLHLLCIMYIISLLPALAVILWYQMKMTKTTDDNSKWIDICIDVHHCCFVCTLKCMFYTAKFWHEWLGLAEMHVLTD